MGEGCGPFREKQACRFSVNILFVCLFVYPNGDGHGRKGDGEHGGLLGGRAEHPRVRAAVGGDSEWARAADPRD